jgi:hypothetical protein
MSKKGKNHGTGSGTVAEGIPTAKSTVSSDPSASGPQGHADMGGSPAGRSGDAIPDTVDSLKTPPLKATSTEIPKVRRRRTKAEIEQARLLEGQAVNAAAAAEQAQLRKQTSATVGTFIKGINPLFEHVLPPALAPDETDALSFVWTEYMVVEGATISPGKAAILVSLIIVMPRMIGFVVRWAKKRGSANVARPVSPLPRTVSAGDN